MLFNSTIWLVKSPIRIQVLGMGNLTHVWGGDSEEKLFGEAQSRKYAPNAWFGELLVWLGMIWGRSGVILECRIPVCNYSVEPYQNHHRELILFVSTRLLPRD